MYIAESNFRRENNNFDVLRLSAAFMVFISHAYGFTKIHIEPLHALTGGYFRLSTWGLMIFFTLSGFLICRSVTRSSSISNYFWKRFLRISPAIAVCSAFTILIPGWLFTTLSTKAFFSHPATWYFLVQNSFPVRVVMFLPGMFNEKSINVSLWTIPVEIKFYVLLPIASLTGLLNKKVLFTSGWIMLVVLNTYFNKEIRDIGGEFRNLHSLLYLGQYFFGGVIFYLYKDKIPVKFPIWLLLLAAWVLVWKFSPAYLQIPTVFLFIYTIIGVGVSSIHIPFPRADISYGFYLYAYPVQASVYYAWGNQLNFWLYNLVCLLIIISLATASWFLVEKKALSLKKRRSVVPAENLIPQPENKANQYKQ